MKVNMAVCGVFHHRKYVGELSKRGCLNAFYYSHKRATTPASLGIVAPARGYNLWAKEYALALGTRAFRAFGSTDWVHPAVHDLWQRQVLGRWEPCDVFHLMLHGTGIKLLERARREGIVTFGEPVMSHPEVMQGIIEREHAYLKIAPPPPMTVPFRRLLREVELSDHLLVGSKFIRDSFVEKGYAADRIYTQSYAADTSKFYPLSEEEKARVSDGKFRVICAGQLVPRKGQHHLLEAWKRLGYSKAEAELVLVGAINPVMEEVLKRYEGVFTYGGIVPHTQLRETYGRASAFVLPSMEDGFGLVVAEAMGVGLPVVTTRNAGSADVVEEGRSGFVVPAGDVEALMDRIERLRRDVGLREAMGRRGTELARTTVSWGGYVEKLVPFYEDVLRRGKSMKS